MKVLITGGSGFIGSHLVDLLLEKGLSVINVDNVDTFRQNLISERYKTYNVDILSPNLEEILILEKPDIIIHLAAQISVAKSIDDPEIDAVNNIIGTIKILEHASKHNVKKVIFSSSCAVYKENTNESLTEESLISPNSFYGLSKFASELYIKQYHYLKNLPYTIFRFGNVYGPRQAISGEGAVIPLFINCAVNKKDPFIFGDGRQTRDFIYVKDVAMAIYLALYQGDNAIFNLGTNDETSINLLWNKISAISNSKEKPIYKTSRIGDIKFSVLNNHKVKKYLSWKPLYSLDMGLKETYDYYLNSKIPPNK